MILDTEIIEAMRQAIIKLGSQRELARQIGVVEQNVSRYLSGKIKKVEIGTWYNMEPILRPYLKTPRPRRETAQTVYHGSAEEGIKQDPNLKPEEKKKLLLKLREIELDRELGIKKPDSLSGTGGSVEGATPEDKKNTEGKEKLA
jgi:hypothetical protein